jgi:DNA-binding transcriptional ArsR family regulator
MSEQTTLEMEGQAQVAAEFLKALAHESRLLVVCLLGEEERNVAELQERLGLSQSNVSQHLAKLRSCGVVETRREGNQVYYRVKDPKVLELVHVLQRLFCG